MRCVWAMVSAVIIRIQEELESQLEIYLLRQSLPRKMARSYIRQWRDSEDNSNIKEESIMNRPTVAVEGYSASTIMRNSGIVAWAEQSKTPRQTHVIIGDIVPSEVKQC